MSSKIKEEQESIAIMIRIFCKSKHKNKHLCEDCTSLLAYATERLERCPYGNDKKTCRICTTHCYKTDMRQQIKEVMRFSGKRMLFHAPFIALKHLWREYKH